MKIKQTTAIKSSSWHLFPHSANFKDSLPPKTQTFSFISFSVLCVYFSVIHCEPPLLWILSFLNRAVGSFWWWRGWVKMSATMVGRQRKFEKKHLLKRLKVVPPKKRNLDQIINHSKSHIVVVYLEILFWAFATFLYSSTRSSGYYQSSFLISDFLAESFKANKN